jgi:AraC family transcriptional regulator of adaptative response / DNA-3-methyladenine glycosylase II
MCRSGDPRFDGWFFVGVTSTGIYCRPSCPSRPPKAENMRFYATAAAAQTAGFRACKRCRPDASPGSPEWNLRADAVGRAMRLIADGVVDRDGVAGLARRLAYTPRHLNRLLIAEVGAGPQALARARRAQSARVLIETTDLPFTQVAYAAGFSSIRQFNDTVRAVFAESPTSLRGRRARGVGPASPGWVALRLARREPFDASGTLDFLGARAIPGVEELAVGERGACFRRSLDLPHGPAIVELEPDDGHVWCRLRLADVADLGVAVQRSRRLLDLDADPVAVDAVLGADPTLQPSVRERPGVRVPGTPDATELALRAVVGQQVTVAGARRTLGRIVETAGVTIDDPVGGVGLRFPPATWWAEQDPTRLPMPGSRARAAVDLARAVVDGDLALDEGADRERTRAALQDIAGIGPWTSAYVTMRALGDPDVWLPGDVALRRATAALGAPQDAPEHWRPWRSYAVMHLWGLKREST